ncbi:MAG TPA: protein kinase [Candidatus Aquilonibacter sp.]|nr:protein kinase [Candidatus Aquilonibacter sp.]
MALAIGSRVGPYEILGPIGAGGMGEVYRARDSKLGRHVAIKVLPEAFARNSERMSRFGREAKLLAALDHTNIASIYGVEDANGTHALVMQLAEGTTLAERLAQGPIPLDDALRISRQICDALEYAHEKGIIHRDLKPANIKVAADDTVKILDFGLAKAMETGPSATDIANSPTISQMATQAGVLLGTAAYMSPEQAKAKPVDRRADIWAFGCLLYEMLTGGQMFVGETVTDTLAAVLTKDPDWSRLPPTTPVRVRALLMRCLQKDPKQRLRDIGDARISLAEVIAGAPEDSPSVVGVGLPDRQWQLWLTRSAAGVLGLTATLFAFLYLHQQLPSGQVIRFEIPLPEKTADLGNFSVSPDGRKIAFPVSSADGQSRVWVRSLDSLDARPLDGTEGATQLPFWSPDSSFIAFFAQGKLKKIESSGGQLVTLCDAPAHSLGAWNSSDKIVFGTATGDLMQVAASGGTPSPIGIRGTAPFFLPDGRHYLYLRVSPTGDGPGIYVGSVDSQPGEQTVKKLLNDASVPVYVPSSGPSAGYLLFVRGNVPGGLGTLMAQPFDARRLELTGDAIQLAERVPFAGYSASATNVLVYVAGVQDQDQLAWFDREGKVLKKIGDPGGYRSLALSPDGKRVAFELVDPQTQSSDLWLYEFGTGVTTRFTFDTVSDNHPVWSPDNGRIAFVSNRGSGEINLYQKAANLAGDDELIFKSPDYKVPTSWSPDGRFLLYYNPNAPAHLWLLPVGGRAADRKPIQLGSSTSDEAFGSFSPDGRWIVYASDETGRMEVYVRSFDAAAAVVSPSSGVPAIGKWMVSKDGGTSPFWRGDGKELFYLALDGSVAAVDVNTSGIFHAGTPRSLFKVPVGMVSWGVSNDGQRFLMAAPSTTSAPAQAPFNIVLNWQAILTK